jgi:predicted metal-dependent phosphoesterase TrpH
MGTITNPFESAGEWLRCALHAHTTCSDGELPPEFLAAHYQRAGYDVLATTDHWHRTVVQSTAQLLVVPSAELNASLPGGFDGHVLAYGIAALPEELAPFPDLESAVRFIDGAGGVAYLAHPYWSGALAEPGLAVDGLAGFEIYNAGCELETGRGVSTVHWDVALGAGRPLAGSVADDSHHPGFDSDLAWVWARCAERSPQAVLDALRRGAFYGSSGPRIEQLELDSDAVEVRCTPAVSITLSAGAQTASRVNAGRLGLPLLGRVLETDGAGLITRARLERPHRGRFGRLELADSSGRRAWTNPLWGPWDTT